MLKLTFKQTPAELMLRAASTIIFNTLNQLDYPLVALSELAENPQYGFTASASIEELGAKFVRITDLKDGGINWNTVPYCKCDEPEKYLIYPNDILFARTGATTGKTHLVKEARYAVFASYLIRIRPKPLVKPEYLYSFFQSDAYWTQILDEKEGSAQPNINGQKLINILVPMVDSEIQSVISKFLEVVRKRQDGSFEELPELPPPLEEQRRIVARVEELVGKFEEVRSLRQKALEETEAFITSLHLSLADSKTVTLDEILTLDEQQERVLFGKQYPQVGVKGFGGGLFAKEAIDATQTTYKVFNCLYEGALVLSQVKGWEGAIGICPSNLVGKYVSPEYRTFRCIPGKAIPEYLSALVATPWFWTKLKDLTRGMGGRRERTRPEQFLKMKIPMPTVEYQQKAIYIFKKIHKMKLVRVEAMKELDSLLPSILDKAFKGEL